jgi:uncharacterized protein YbjT (DUF2867 family)
MSKSVLIAGATGLVGSSVINLLKEDSAFNPVIILTRRDIPALRKYLNIKQHIIDFDNYESYKEFVKADAVVCALGTTIKKAGSQEKFRKVDYEYPLRLAEAASENKCEKYILVSSVGANPDSKNFYLRVKGEIEKDLAKLNFKSIHFLHPSLLLGERDEKRAGEGIAQKAAPLMKLILPYKFKPIEADTIARKIRNIILTDPVGFKTYEGKELYE